MAQPGVLTVDPNHAKHDRPVTKRNITTTKLKFSLTTPLTDRQPYFTDNPFNLFLAQQRNHWLDLFRLPVFISKSGSNKVISVVALDEPVSATEAFVTGVPGMFQREGEVTDIPTIWGATTTTTLMTTITAVPGDIIFLQIPTLTAPPPLQYTTIDPAPTDPNSKQFPNGQPILVLTQLNGIVVNPANRTLTTITTVQPPPQFSADFDGTKLELAHPDSSWSTWTTDQKGGVIVSSVVAGLVFLAICVYLCILRYRRKRVEDAEFDVENKGDKAIELKENLKSKFKEIYEEGKKTVNAGSDGAMTPSARADWKQELLKEARVGLKQVDGGWVPDNDGRAGKMARNQKEFEKHKKESKKQAALVDEAGQEDNPSGDVQGGKQAEDQQEAGQVDVPKPPYPV